MAEETAISSLNNENTLITAGIAAAFTHFLFDGWITIVFATLVITLLQERVTDSSSKRYIVGLSHIAIIASILTVDLLTADEIILSILHLNLASCYFFPDEERVHLIVNTTALIASGTTGLLIGWSTIIVVGTLSSILLWSERKTTIGTWRIPSILWGCTFGVILAFEAISGGIFRAEEITVKGIESWKMLLLGPTLGAALFETLRTFVEETTEEEE